MANFINPGTFHPLRVNQYVSRMQYAADVNYGGSTRINFGLVVAAQAANVLNVANAAVGSPADLSTIQIAVPFGRNLQVVGNVTMGTTGITIRGYDYLGQPMAEAFTMNGVTPVLGNKAFKYLTQVTWPAVAGGTFTIGFGAKLGLPYRAIAQRLETAAGLPVTTQGTFVAGTNTGLTQAAGQPDPRGTYTPNTTPTGGIQITAMFDFANDTFGTIATAGEVGGLMGLPHITF